MSEIELLIAIIVAALGSWVNAVAGGGTFLTFPYLTYSGLSAVDANMLSTMALWPGVAASWVAYRKHAEKHIPAKRSFVFISIIGSALGAWLLLYLPEGYFEQAVPWMLLFAAVLLSIGPSIKKSFIRSSMTMSEITPGQIRSMLIIQFFIAIYGGYFGAGIGILMLAALQFIPFSSIHQTNAMKVLLGMTINAVAFGMFAISGDINWSIASWMILGGIIGGYLGTKLALKVNPTLMRRIILTIAWLTTLAYFTL